ncbi:helix-turn-helix transcriptional regulator [Lusitaniella coriacea LEGE 07157]|uniref:Helix-turn-helix transcriptional regulator n=2 Tax=Lusitaniella TaxID=1983104 RepID=A0A8J7IUW9_9CYAN|nr:helix-turn-helix transcriptional regulator [Lusitaniella coriacea LEGE 07157]
MAIENADFPELVEQAQEQGEQICQPIELGVQYNLPKSIGTGTCRVISLRNGLTIETYCATLAQTVKIKRQHERQFPLVAKFYLSGSSRVRTPKVSDISRDYEEVTGWNYLYHLPEHTEVEEWQSNRPIHVVMIHANVDYFSSFNLADKSLPQPLQVLFQKQSFLRFHQPLGRISPAMSQTVQQMLQCPYQGLTQQLYLESKALELFSLQFSCWTEERHSTPQRFRLQSADIDSLHHAREIIIRHAQNPPSLAEIARQVGLNDCKLKQGFRQVFGTTVFGYLQDYRMQQAQQLLLNSNLSIAGIAAMVGYRNPEAFSTAFRKKFAISPKTYQLSKFN